MGLLCLWPVILVCVVIARSDTQLSGIFAQNRVGQNGRMIKVLKIRTMRIVQGMESTITVGNDRRITPNGKKMRQWKLDELPQLWNVLIGEMSFVGPRPDVPGYADSLIGPQRQILELKPGITGPATIKYREEEQLLATVSNAEYYNDMAVYPDKVKLNLDYLQNWSLLTDIKYILITIRLLPVPDELKLSCNATHGEL